MPQEFELQIALEVEMRGEFAGHEGGELIPRQGTGLGRGGGRRVGARRRMRHRDRGRTLGGDRDREQGRGAGEREKERKGRERFHGNQRFICATFWSISSEVWMDLELIS